MSKFITSHAKVQTRTSYPNLIFTDGLLDLQLLDETKLLCDALQNLYSCYMTLKKEMFVSFFMQD